MSLWKSRVHSASQASVEAAQQLVGLNSNRIEQFVGVLYHNGFELFIVLLAGLMLISRLCELCKNV